MKNYVVIQQGGSTREFYAAAYASKREATKAIASHAKATYRACGPFEIPVLDDNTLGPVLEALEAACAATVGW